jgi:osmotically-inducible protein OsmY
MTMTTAEPRARYLDHPSTHLTQDDLATAVEAALWSHDPIRLSMSRLAVTEHDGHVTLTGNMRSDTLKTVAGQLVRRVPGVRDVTNAVVTDTEIESLAALALAMDDATRLTTDRIALKSLLGVIYLGGLVVAPELAAAERARDRASELVGAVPGVREVVNDILVAEGAGQDVDPSAADGHDEPSGPSPDEEAIKERLSVWRERAGAGTS